jgi:hypothetical protein
MCGVQEGETDCEPRWSCGACIERAATWSRLERRLVVSEGRLEELAGDTTAPLYEAVEELRQARELRPRLDELHGLVAQLDARARELLIHWLAYL